MLPSTSSQRSTSRQNPIWRSLLARVAPSTPAIRGQAGASPSARTGIRSRPACAGPGTRRATGRAQIPKTATNILGMPPGDRAWGAPQTDRRPTPSTRGGLRVAHSALFLQFQTDPPPGAGSAGHYGSSSPTGPDVHDRCIRPLARPIHASGIDRPYNLGVPESPVPKRCHTPSSRTPAFDHLSLMQQITQSLIRSSKPSRKPRSAFSPVRLSELVSPT